ncbi:MAG: hypothetical protein OES46_21545, partial [Gammaproteobacteria bacterium]|nr:hypothetical protein [Gammaproteobacteria bacterium]
IRHREIIIPVHVKLRRSISNSSRVEMRDLERAIPSPVMTNIRTVVGSMQIISLGGYKRTALKSKPLVQMRCT